MSKAAPAGYTLRKAAEDWLANGLSGRSAKTIRKNKDVLEPILAVIGTRKIRELDLADVDKALSTIATSYSTSVVVMAHNALARTIRYAQARRLVAQNVATLADTPKGTSGRPSKSMTPDQVTIPANPSPRPEGFRSPVGSEAA